MRINKRMAMALYCKSIGISADLVKAKIKSRDLTLQDIFAQAMVEIACHPFSAEALMEMVMPGRSKAKRQKKVNETNNEAFQALLAIKQAQEKAKQKEEVKKPKPKRKPRKKAEEAKPEIKRVVKVKRR